MKSDPSCLDHGIQIHSFLDGRIRTQISFSRIRSPENRGRLANSRQIGGFQDAHEGIYSKGKVLFKDVLVIFV